MLTVMQTVTPNGVTASMMTQVGRVVGSDSLMVAWGVHLLVSVVLAVMFAVIAGSRGENQGTAPGWGLLFGLIVWVVAWQIAMPLLLGEPVFGFVRHIRAVPFAVGSLLGHIIYGAVLGSGVWWLGAPDKAQASAQSEKLPRAA